MTKLFAAAFVLLLAGGCGGDSFSAGQGGADATGGSGADGGPSGSGGSGQAGKSSGGDTSQGNTGSGGEDEGGTGSGGTSSGGTNTSGTDAGGSSSGGTAAGSTSSGGMPGGGTAAGGTDAGGMSTGGLSTGGFSSTTSCQGDEDCVACAYDRAPNTSLNCYCVGCAETPMNVTSCTANQKRYEQVCALVDLTCPAIKCQPPAPVYCVKGRCTDAQ